MKRSTEIKAGAAYFAIVFGVGFLLGMLRVLVVIPKIGEANAVMLELPVILGVSWFVSRWLVATFGISTRWTSRLAMGGVAFGLTMLAEFGVAHVVFGRTVDAYIAGYQSTAALLGLGGQIVFGLIPLIQTLTNQDRPEQ
jgi:hypothetical protein